MNIISYFQSPPVYSYSYDITHSLQINMAPPRHISHLKPDKYTSRVEYSNIPPQEPPPKTSPDTLFPAEEAPVKPTLYGVRTQPNQRFVWNSHLLAAVEQDLHPDWLLFIMHGFIGQSNVSKFYYYFRTFTIHSYLSFTRAMNFINQC